MKGNRAGGMRKQILKERAEKGKRVVEAWPVTSGVQGVKCRYGQYECQNKAKDLVIPAKAICQDLQARQNEAS